MGPVEKVQEHLVRTYVRYLGRGRVGDFTKQVGTRRRERTNKTRGRPIIRPADRGHQVDKLSGRQYCLGCSRNTKSKTQQTLWKNNGCRPCPRMKLWIGKAPA